MRRQPRISLALHLGYYCLTILGSRGSKDDSVDTFGNWWAAPELTEPVFDSRKLERRTLYESVSFRD